jgi:hypothetical protein
MVRPNHAGSQSGIEKLNIAKKPVPTSLAKIVNIDKAAQKPVQNSKSKIWFKKQKSSGLSNDFFIFYF